MRTWRDCSGRSIWNRIAPSERVRILVTGGGGFAGRHLLRELLQVEGAVVGATVLGEVPRWPGGHPFEGVEWMSLDLCSSTSAKEVVRSFRPDRIYHLAGQASVGESLDQPVFTWEVNATGTLRLLHALQDAKVEGVRLVLASSAEVYGAVPSADQPILESRPARPLTPYGSSKVAAETVVSQYARAGVVNAVIARSFNHIGPGQDERFVLPSMAAQLVAIGRGERAPVLEVGNVEVSRDFLDVRDAVRGYVTLMEHGDQAETYNICSGRSRTLMDVLERLVELSGTRARIEVDPERVRPIDIPLLEGDSGRLQALGWHPSYSLDRTLSDLLDEAASRA